MQLEKNMYVRIKNEAGWCCIGKIENINDFREPSMKYCIDIQDIDFIFIPEDMIAKASHNIIDLIEVGDYVNGEKIIKIADDFAGRKILIWGFDDGKHQVANAIYKEDIKSIVTKEQFEQMQYKVGE